MSQGTGTLNRLTVKRDFALELRSSVILSRAKVWSNQNGAHDPSKSSQAAGLSECSGEGFRGSRKGPRGRRGAGEGDVGYERREERKRTRGEKGGIYVLPKVRVALAEVGRRSPDQARHKPLSAKGNIRCRRALLGANKSSM